MNETAKNKKQPLFRTVILTAICTILLVGGFAYYAGYLTIHPDKSQNAAEATGSQPEENTKYTCGMHPMVISDEPGYCPLCEMALTPIKNESSTEENNGERQIAYWQAPMNPAEIYDKPGKSAMGMDLVPVYEDEIIGGVAINIDPVTQQNMGLRTAAAEKGPLETSIRTYGHITYDQTRITQINLKFSGWIEKLYVDFEGQVVEKDQPLFDIYSPELITAQEDYLEAYRNMSRNPSAANKNLLAAVHRRLTLFDISEQEIKDIKKSGTSKHAITFRSPFKGIVTVNNALTGKHVKSGTIVYEIADISNVWIEAHIYEFELSQVVPGQKAVMTLPYQPGKTFEGKVAYVYPFLQKKTRDVVVRLEFENPDLELKPEMYANVKIMTSSGDMGTKIPSEAVIRTGERNIIFISKGNGKFIPRDVTLGAALDKGMVHVITGVAPGESVVTSGQFLLDSESRLKEATKKMLDIAKPEVPAKQSDDDFFDDLTEDENDDFFDELGTDQ
jgi:Cu(I)/Ag(I) efflux system membrane fusion protein/cobalt-zinc-cadmium efflux system membrane fusion protein